MQHGVKPALPDKGAMKLCPLVSDELYNSGSVPFKDSVLSMAIELGTA